MPRPVHFGRVGIIPQDNTTVLSHIMVAGQTLTVPRLATGRQITLPTLLLAMSLRVSISL